MRQAASYANSQAHPDLRERARPEPGTPALKTAAVAAEQHVYEVGSWNTASGQIPYLHVRRVEETWRRQAFRVARLRS